MDLKKIYGRGEEIHSTVPDVVLEVCAWMKYVFFTDEESSDKIMGSWLGFPPEGCSDPVESLVISIETILFSPVEFVVSNFYLQIFHNADTFRIPTELLSEEVLTRLLTVLLHHKGSFKANNASMGGFRSLDFFRHNKQLNLFLDRTKLFELFLCALYNVTNPDDPEESIKLQKFVMTAIARILNTVSASGETRTILSPDISPRLRSGLNSDEALTEHRIAVLRQISSFLASPGHRNRAF